MEAKPTRGHEHSPSFGALLSGYGSGNKCTVLSRRNFWGQDPLITAISKLQSNTIIPRT